MKPNRPKKSKTLQSAKPGSHGSSRAVAGGREATFREVVGMIQAARGRALQAVNTELVELYWQVGGFISGKIETAAWGEGVVEELARFIARQMRMSTDTKDFYLDLVFYNYVLKCFVIFDLKPRELTHGDIGQMDIYPVRYSHEHIPLRVCPPLAQRRKLLRRLHERPASSFCRTPSWRGLQHVPETTNRTRLLRSLPLSNRRNEAREVSENRLGEAQRQESSERLSHGVNVRMFDEQQPLDGLGALRRGAGDDPTVGSILCAAKDASMVRYSVLHGNEKLFATRYKLVLPSEEQLRAELIREQRLIAEQASVRAAKSHSPKRKKP